MVTPNSIAYYPVYKDPDRYCSQPIIEKMLNGEVIISFAEDRHRAHYDNGRNSVIKSADGGKTWDPATKVILWDYTDKIGNVDAAVTQLSNGTLIASLQAMKHFEKGINWGAPQLESGGISLRLKDTHGVYVLKSTDNGKTWSEPIPVNVKPMHAAGTRVGVTELPDGGLLLPLYGQLNAAPSSPSAERDRSFIVRSDDGGENWEYWGTIAFDPAYITDYNELAILRLTDGRFIAMMRTHMLPTSRPDNFTFCISEDGGVNWSQPRRTNIWGYPADLLNLRDGRVLMVYGYRKDEFGVKGCISEDGVTWDIANGFTISEGGHGPPDLVAFYHTGYPSSTQLDDGTIITAYHVFSKDETPVQCIECAHYTL